MSIRIIIILISLMLINFFPVFSQEENPEQNKTEVLPLADFIKIVCENSHFEEILMNELYLQYEETLNIPHGDFILDVTAGYNFQYSEDIKESSHGLSLNTSLSKLFAFSGTELTIDYKINPGGIYSENSSKLTLGIEQEIIQNAFGKTNKLKKEIAGMEKQVAKFQILEAYEDFLAALLSLYHNWYISYENVLNARSSLDDSRQLLADTSERAEYNIAKQIDLDKSQLQVLTKTELLLKAEAEYETNLIKIKDTMQTEMAEDVHIIPELYFPEIDEQKLDEDLSLFMVNSRTYNILEELKEIDDLSKVIAYNDLLPSASLYLNYSMSGEGYIFLSEREHEINFGINFLLPIFNEHDKAAYQISELNIDKSYLAAKNKMQNLNKELLILCLSIKHYIKLIELASLKIQYAESITEGEENNYKKGISDLNDLISAYNTLESNNYTRNNYLIQLNLAYIEWLRITDSLVNNNLDILE